MGVIVKKKGIILFCLLIIYLCFNFNESVDASGNYATASGPYSWRDPGGIIHQTAYITINGIIAYCMDPDVRAPYGGVNYGSPTVYDDAMKAILYYGYGGDGNQIGNTIEDYVKTYVALNNWSKGKTTQSTYSNRDPDVWNLIQHAINKDAPNYDIAFDKSWVSSYISGDVQKSETITLNGQGDATLNIPNDVTIFIVGGISQKGGSVKIAGGQSFYFTAPLDYGSDLITGNVNANRTNLASLLYLPISGNYQRLISGQYVIDPISKAGFTVDFEIRKRTITVKHVDARDGTLISSDSETKVIGSYYNYSPRNDLKKGDYTYRPISTAVQAGTLGNEDITLTFYYDVPLIKTGLKKVQIYTAPADQGLPIKIDLEKTNIYPNNTPGITDAKINLNVYQGSQLVFEKPYNAQNLPVHVDLTIPNTFLDVDQKNNYTVKLEGYNSNDIDVVIQNQQIQLDGYTSSEQTVKVDSERSSELSYKGVVMTEREAQKEMKTYYETVQIPVNKLKKMRTGYGFEMPLSITYKNEIGVKLNSLAFSMIVPEKIVDKSYIEYPTKDEKATVLMENTKQDNKNEGNTAVSIQKWELPHVNIEKITGHLFSDEQVADKDSRITKELLDGDRKFYLPIWGYIGDYPIKVESNEGIGVNKINIEVSHNLNVFAHMYGHIDSNTEKQDAIYLRPINSDKPNYPKSWTKEEIKRFEEWNNK